MKLKHLLYIYWSVAYLPQKLSIQVLWLVPNEAVCFIMMLKYQPHQIYDLQIFSSFCYLLTNTNISILILELAGVLLISAE